MSVVVLRCPHCGTTQSAPGECHACSEADVRYFCRNHEPGRWLDAPACPTCGARFGERPRPRQPPPVAPRTPRPRPRPDARSAPPPLKGPWDTPPDLRLPDLRLPMLYLKQFLFRLLWIGLVFIAFVIITMLFFVAGVVQTFGARGADDHVAGRAGAHPRAELTLGFAPPSRVMAGRWRQRGATRTRQARPTPLSTTP